uniref:Uncharacterized protein n=1 Tax=Avena sativa TaxID=4498 RepID=A0ACD5WGS4_AVESA
MVKPGRPVTIVLPCFRRATSIELDTCFLPIKLPPAGELPALEMLSISGNIVDLGALLNRCPRLRVLRVTFRGVKPGTLELAIAALQAAAALGLVLSRLGIEFDYVDGGQNIDGACFASLLGAVATLSPLELFFENGFREWTEADMLCFPHTTSIEMNLYRLRFKQLPAGEFSALERLSLSGCTLVNIVTMVSRCPRLRVLKVIADKFARDVTVHSASLQELEICVTERSWCRRIDIRTPLLKQLNLNVHGNTALTVSIMAPLLEKVSWRWEYAELPLMFGFWSLRMVKLVTAESNNGKDGVLNNDAQDACSPHPCINVLSLDVNASYHLGAAMNFVAEIEKIPVTNFSVLELHITQRGHVYGAFLLCLFGMHHIRTAIRSLKVLLPWHEMSGTLGCLENCPCNEPTNWRSQNISLDNLAEVEIDNFRGGDHETDFLTLIFKWAPILKRMTVRISPQIKQDKFKACAMDTRNIFSAYPSVNCSLFIGHTSIPSTCS